MDPALILSGGQDYRIGVSGARSRAMHRGAASAFPPVLGLTSVRAMSKAPRHRVNRRVYDQVKLVTHVGLA